MKLSYMVFYKLRYAVDKVRIYHIFIYEMLCFRELVLTI